MVKAKSGQEGKSIAEVVTSLATEANSLPQARQQKRPDPPKLLEKMVSA